jgi:hypothetical protein
LNQGAKVSTLNKTEHSPASFANRWAILESMAFAAAVVVPFLFRGNPSGHDFEYHLASWVGVTRQWSEGVFYPRWWPDAHFGFGEPRFIFYPPLSWMLGAGLGLLLPWKVVPGAFGWLSLTLAGASTYRLTREWLPRKESLWAAALYISNPYSLIVLCHRSAFAELLASSLLPLAVLYALRISRPNGAGRLLDIARLAFVVAAIWLADAPAAVVAGYALALLVGVAALERRALAPLLSGAAAGALGLGLAAFYLVPAAYEQKWVQIASVIEEGLRPADNFLFTRGIDEEHWFFNLLVSSVAAAELALAAIVFTAVVLAIRRARAMPAGADSAPAAGSSGSAASQPPAREALVPLLALCLVSGILMLRPSAPLWNVVPYLKFVQFPWRWLSIFNLGVVFAVVAAPPPKRLPHAWKALAICLWLLLGSVILYLPPWGATDIPDFIVRVESGSETENLNEFLPITADSDQLGPGFPPATVAQGEEPEEGVRISVVAWRGEEKLVSVETPQPLLVALRLLNYPAWQVEVNGEIVVAETEPDTGQIQVEVPAGHSVVRVRFVRTADRTIGGAISAAALLAVAGLIFVEWRKRSPQRNTQNT